MRVVWTKRAQKKLVGILEYIQQEFGNNAKQEFRSRVIDFTSLLPEFPELGTLDVKDKNLRGFQLTKQTRAYYRIKDERIIMLTFFDSRQDPKKKPR
jgi:plasmid stabilization system protein ParE